MHMRESGKMTKRILLDRSLHSLFPMYYLSKCIGIMPISIMQINGNYFIQFSWFSFSYSIFMLLCFATLVYFFLMDDIFSVTLGVPVHKVKSYVMYLHVFIYSLSFLSSCVMLQKSYKLPDLADKFTTSDLKFLLQQKHHKNILTCNFIQMGIRFFCFISCVYFGCSQAFRSEMSLQYGCMWIFLLYVSISFQFCSICIFLHKYLLAINKHISMLFKVEKNNTLVSSRSFITTSTMAWENVSLHELRRLYGDMCDITHKLNGLYGFPLLCFILTLFIALVMTIFFGIFGFVREEMDNYTLALGDIVSWIIFMCTELIYLTAFPSRIVDEVSKVLYPIPFFKQITHKFINCIILCKWLVVALTTSP